MTTHVTIIAPGARRGQLRDSAPHADVYHEGVPLTRSSPSPTTGYAWDGPLDSAALDAAKEIPGVKIYVRGEDAESMDEAIVEEGFVRDVEEDLP